MQTHRAMLVPASLAPLARGLAVSFAPVSGAGMYLTPVYAKGGSIPFYASNGPIDEQFAALVDDPTGDALWAAVSTQDNPPPESDIRALMAGSVVRADCTVLQLIAELGLHGHDNPNQEPT